jgi:hypothetical protein
MDTIDEELLQAIASSDKEADKLTAKARDAITKAMEARRATGALIEKLKTFRGQVMLGMLEPIMSGEKVKRMLTINFYDRAGKPFLSDKVQLQKAGILDMAQAKNLGGSRRKGVNVIGSTSKGVASIQKVLKRMGGIDRLPEWQQRELQTKLRPLAEAYVHLAQGKK